MVASNTVENDTDASTYTLFNVSSSSSKPYVVTVHINGQAYLQLPLDEASRKYVTINTQKGLYQYTRLPFGVASAPSIFQRTMENLLRGIPKVCVYLDDILITGATEIEHLNTYCFKLPRASRYAFEKG